MATPLLKQRLNSAKAFCLVNDNLVTGPSDLSCCYNKLPHAYHVDIYITDLTHESTLNAIRNNKSLPQPAKLVLISNFLIKYGATVAGVVDESEVCCSDAGKIKGKRHYPTFYGVFASPLSERNLPKTFD